MSEREIVCVDLGSAIDDLRGEGFRLDLIYPADDPCAAVLSRGAERVRLTSRPDAPRPQDALPPFAPDFILTRAATSAGQGRAGMFYRDLIPKRLGGRYIASHICIPEGGPVADWVHFHRIALQIIYVRRGWVQVVYEDQGDPFVMREGDLVLQPPEIRHRVLESSAALEVVEISAPAVHATFADHQLELPNGSNPTRLYGGQRFVHHKAAGTLWTAFRGGDAQETAVADATGRLADVRTVRGNFDMPSSEGELVFGFVLDGSASLEFGKRFSLSPADSFVIPPGASWSVWQASDDFRLLQVLTTGLPTSS